MRIKLLPNLSPLDNLQRLLPFKGRWSRVLNSLFFSGMLYLALMVAAFFGGETSILFRDYSTPAVIVLVGYFLIMEPYIGDQIRKSEDGLEDLFRDIKNLPEDLELIFDNRFRGSAGIAAALAFVILFPSMGSHLWYNSQIVRDYILLLGVVMLFILGEVLIGVFTIIFVVHKISAHLRDINILDTRQPELLKSLGNWCLQCATLGAIAVALAFPSFVFAPWRGQVLLVDVSARFGLFFVVPVIIGLSIGPLYSLHKALSDSKTKHLHKTVKHYRDFKDTNDILEDALADEDSVSTRRWDKHLAFLSTVDVELSINRNTPDWPWDPAVFQTLVASIVASIASFAIVTLL